MTSKWNAQYDFWSSFGIPAYDAASVPDGDDAPDFPYITYTGYNSGFDEDARSLVSIWTRDTSWAGADAIADQIHDALVHGGAVVPYDGGMIWITAGEPFAQNIGDPNDDLIRRKVLNIILHFC